MLQTDSTHGTVREHVMRGMVVRGARVRLEVDSNIVDGSVISAAVVVIGGTT